MKKGFLWFLILAFAASSLVLVGCGDDDGDGGGGTNPPGVDDIDDFDFAIVISEWDDGSRTHYWDALITPVDYTNPITTLTLSIGGNEVTVNNDWGVWMGNLGTLTPGQSYTVEAVINGTTFSQDITISYWPSTTLPTTWDITQPLELNWTMAGNNMWQSIYADYVYWMDGSEETWDDVEMELAASARSATLPANWVDIPTGAYYDVDLSILEVNWAYNNRFLVLSDAENYEMYWSEHTDAERHERARQHLDTVLDLLGN